MKSYLKIISFLILAEILLTLDIEAENVPQETYVSQIVINLPWETKPEKLGRAYFLRGEGEAMPPKESIGFTISLNGDIYLVDRINHRVLRFSPGGEFLHAIDSIDPDIWNGICVDRENNIYVSYGHIPFVEDTIKIYVQKYNSKGEPLCKYQLLKPEEISKCIEDYSLSLFLDSFDNLYAQYHPFYYCAGITFKFGTPDRELPLEIQKEFCLEGGLGGNGLRGNRFYKQVYWPPEEEGILITDAAGKKIKTFKTTGGYFLGADSRNNLYFYSHCLLDEDSTIYPYWMIAKGKKGDHILAFNNYDEGENLISTIYWKPPVFPVDNIYVNGSDIDQGNIYALTFDEIGIRIIKWSPVEGGK